MNKETEQALLQKVSEEIEKTSNAIKDYREMTIPEGLDNAVGRVSRMDAINNKSVTQAALRQAEEKLRKLKYIESQIGKPGFGECARCKKTIPAGRILLLPQSIYCVSCAR